MPMSARPRTPKCQAGWTCRCGAGRSDDAQIRYSLHWQSGSMAYLPSRSGVARLRRYPCYLAFRGRVRPWSGNSNMKRHEEYNVTVTTVAFADLCGSGCVRGCLYA